LIALLDRGDPAHDSCVATLQTLRQVPLTVWPAFTEAMYLLRGSWAAQNALWSRVETGALAFAALDEEDAPRIRELMEKYRDLPMDLADAALVRVAERDGVTDIFTLDRRHFTVYRPGRRRRFAIVP
jgi:predicted nucleic acid-binding protein